MRFRIQRFNEEGAAEVTAETAEVAEVDEVQAKIDMAITKAQAKWEAEVKKREEQAERLSKLSEDERQKAELENTRNELEKQKADFEREKLKYEAAKVLSQRNLPVDFVDYLIGDTNEATLGNIKIFEKQFNKAVEDVVTTRLKGKAPQTGGGKSIDSDGGKESFLKAIMNAQIKYR